MAETSLNEERPGLLIWQTSNLWQSKLRFKLKKYNISLNEYLIIETLYKINSNDHKITQAQLSKQSFIDVAVVSTTLNLLEKKKLAIRNNIDNRTKYIKLTSNGKVLVKSIIKVITEEENELFKKLGFETFNFTNSLKLLLGKKIRIKAGNN